MFINYFCKECCAALKITARIRLGEIGRDVYDELKKEWACTFDLSGSIGRRYARADETGIYASVTIDFESLEDDSVTIRSRDTTEQIRVKIKDLKEVLRKFLGGEKLGKLGSKVE